MCLFLTFHVSQRGEEGCVRGNVRCVLQVLHQRWRQLTRSKGCHQGGGRIWADVFLLSSSTVLKPNLNQENKLITLVGVWLHTLTTPLKLSFSLYCQNSSQCWRFSWKQMSCCPVVRGFTWITLRLRPVHSASFCRVCASGLLSLVNWVCITYTCRERERELVGWKRQLTKIQFVVKYPAH